MSERSWWGAELLDQGGSDEVWAAGGEEVTFGTLRKETAWMAGALESHGIRSGHTVALHGGPSFTQQWAILALWSLGAQVVLLDPRLDDLERAALLELSAPQFVVSLGGPRDPLDQFTGECEVFVRRMRGGRPAVTSHCVVQFSSGTTDRPKAVGRTPESLLTELDRLRNLPGMPVAGERVAVLEPVSHSFALIGGVLHALAAGATVVFPAGRQPQAVVRAAAGADVVIGNPRHFDRLAAADEGVALPRLRLAVSGGDMLSRTTAEAFRRRYGIPVGQAYGTTETGIVATDLQGRFGWPYIGRPVPGVRTRVVGRVLEVHVPQSPYLYEEQRWPGGWMSTSDLVTVDAGTGALRLRGRVQGADGPTSVDLLEIESVLRSHEHVTDAVVVNSELIEAHVASTAGLDGRELRSWCRRLLGDARAPDLFHVVPALPRTANGKVVRDPRRLRRSVSGTRPAASVGGER